MVSTIPFIGICLCLVSGLRGHGATTVAEQHSAQLPTVAAGGVVGQMTLKRWVKCHETWENIWKTFGNWLEFFLVNLWLIYG